MGIAGGTIRVAALSALLTAGCAGLPLSQALPWNGSPSASGNRHLDYLLEARGRDDAGRELLWQQAAAGRGGGDAASELRLALLQSLEGHSGYAPAAAERRLRSLRAAKPPAEIDAVARLRLSELQEYRHWRGEADRAGRELERLKDQLARLIAIERRSADP